MLGCKWHILCAGVVALIAALAPLFPGQEEPAAAQMVARVAFVQPSAALPPADRVQPDNSAAGPLSISAHSDGMFYLVGHRKGAPIRMLVDTGAYITVLTRSDAQRLGLQLQNGAPILTAGGPTPTTYAQVDQIVIAGHEIRDLRVAVVASALPTSLLGRDAIAQLGRVIFEKDRLTIEPGAAENRTNAS